MYSHHSKKEYCSLAWQKQCVNKKCEFFIDRKTTEYPVKILNKHHNECGYRRKK